jgi:CBS domain containing-hemolysin-like protein
MSIYAVRLHSDDGTLAGLGAHELRERPIEGTKITLNEETWTVEEVDDTRLPPQVTLMRPVTTSPLL